MAKIFGHLGINDSEYVWQLTSGQGLIWDTAQEYLARVNADINQAMSVFVSGETENRTDRYKLPGSGGGLQRRSSNGRYAAVKADGEFDVAFPLEDFGAMLAGNDVDMAYMTVAELDNHINTIVDDNIITLRFELLKALLNNTQDSFVDRAGTFAIEPLANGDTVVYPPVLGSTTAATEDHYLGSSYAAASISDTNDPYVTIADELEEHFGTPTGGSEIAVFINSAQRAKTLDLAAFTPITDMHINPGNDTATVNGMPPRLMANSGWRILGRHDELGVWVVEWRHIPASYLLGVHLGVEAPLKKRVDPAAVGLGTGLQLVATDEKFPFTESIWRHRFGFGVANRLNGVVMDLSNTDSDYDIPTAYA